MIKGILINMGLNNSPRDPCLLSGTRTKPYSPTNSQHSTSQLYVGLYVNGFFFYSSDTLHEELFKTLLQYQIKVDFMGNVDYFLGTAFNCLTHKDVNISVHLCQSAFIEFTAHHFSVHIFKKFPNMTPYLYGYPIESIPPVDPRGPNLP